MSRIFRSTALHIILALLAGLGVGLFYSWRISPVTYVDAHPALLRADFKDQYRIVIAASYESTQGPHPCACPPRPARRRRPYR
ncbi:MAG: hypothetical protein HND47_20320 [Chloroflexi bacterium]|nr:hypothetical protein [Chloroflexota bacterium]